MILAMSTLSKPKRIQANCNKSSVIRQKGQSQDGANKKAKQAKFSEKQAFLTPWYAWSALLSCYLSCYLVLALRFTLLPYYRRSNVRDENGNLESDRTSPMSERNRNKTILAVFKSFEQPSDTWLPNQHNKQVKDHEQPHVRIDKILKLYNAKKGCSNLTYILLKLGKCIKKHATSTHPNMAASMDSLLVRFLL